MLRGLTARRRFLGKNPRGFRRAVRARSGSGYDLASQRVTINGASRKRAPLPNHVPLPVRSFLYHDIVPRV